jgi:hypothetical protein
MFVNRAGVPGQDSVHHRAETAALSNPVPMVQFGLKVAQIFGTVSGKYW